MVETEEGKSMTTETEVRTRIAPSPTGDPHIGTAFMLLFNYAFAKKHGGKVLLRIEDTDQTRSTADSERAILESLKWLGLKWDEGPDVGGPAGPYRQSERTELYREHCQTLLAKGHAYRCFCTPERLAELRSASQSTAYDKRCASLADAEVQKNLDAKLPFVVRMRVPSEGDCVFHDTLRGDIVIPWKDVDDQVLLKTDNFPTYHLANVVDDHLMGITHVMRGEEWISSGPKHVLLYEHFGWEAPQFCHLPLLRNPDKSKLSKRKNPTSIRYYREAGFLPEALVNYLGLMGYTLPDGREMFTLDEMVESFDLKRISLGGPVFDIAKLQWLNGRYLREKLSVGDLVNRMQEWKLNSETWEKILPLAQKRIEKLSDIVPMTAFFFSDQVTYDPAALVPAGMKVPQENLPSDLDAPPAPGLIVARLFRIALWEFEKLRAWNSEVLQACVTRLAEKEEMKLRDVTAPFFVAMTGSPVSTPLFESMAILGSDLVRRRLHSGLEALAKSGFALSGKKLKALEEHYKREYSEA
jgi:glutamyl-tRNA synthetase